MDFSATIGPSMGAGGSDHVLIQIGNASPSPCQVNGFLGLSFLDAAHHPIAIRVIDDPALSETKPAPTPITLASGAKAAFEVQWDQGPIDPAGRPCAAVNELAISIPGRSAAVLAGATTADGVSISLCGNSVEVGPVTPPQ